MDLLSPLSRIRQLQINKFLGEIPSLSRARPTLKIKMARSSRGWTGPKTPTLIPTKSQPDTTTKKIPTDSKKKNQLLKRINKKWSSDSIKLA